MIGFNKPYFTGRETDYIRQAVAREKISGDGWFTRKCQNYFEETFQFKKSLLTTSCTDALELAALLINIQAGDEIIAPSYTFVSTVNAFVLRGAKVVFADSCASHPCLDVDTLEPLITKKTKAVIPVHYAGVACNLDPLQELTRVHHIYLVEDAAQAIASSYRGKPLGSFGALSTFSFHETKNIISGEGGLLAINDDAFIPRAEILREKGTNRAAFFRGEVDKYNWVDIGSSFLPSEIIAAFLFAQIENLQEIQQKRLAIWKRYQQNLQWLSDRGRAALPFIPSYATPNAHNFYLVCKSLDERTRLIEYLKERHIQAVFHYVPLHQSSYYTANYAGAVPHLPHAERFGDCLVRLPFFFELTNDQIDTVCQAVSDFYQRI
jgi:dTDP-4-amino-4,6-dideoxygalactose transaminase